MIDRNNMIERFLGYTKVYTTSDPNSETAPSTKRQFDLLNILSAELTAMGINNEISEFGVLYAKIPSNTEKSVPAVGFIAHVDTAPDFNGENVKGQILENYDGKDIKLCDEYVLSPTDFPELLNYVNQTLIHTDGTTLLGADDKAGIAIIMEMAKYITANPEVKHGDICIGFTPDEEIGRGTVNFDVARFGAEFAYTIDGGIIGELAFENFNAYSLVLDIKGRNVHPGTAKNQMVNAGAIGIKFDNMLDQQARPQYTEGYEGFMHMTNMTASVEEANLSYIIRDHDAKKIEEYQALIAKNVELLQAEFPIAEINYTVNKQYLNMAEVVAKRPEIVEFAKQAMIKADVTPSIEPIRGGTDGSNLSFIGLPCPNIFTGGHNFHGRFEYVCVESMLKASEVVINIVKEIEQN